MYQIPYTTVVEGSISNPWELQFTLHPSVNSKFKRCLDIVGSLVGLSIMAVLFIPIAIAIKIDSPGPIFFTQERYGLQGRKFQIRKFRSMVPNAEQLKSLVSNEANGLIFKNKNDFRVTRVGRFLRSTSLDELPQFFNVLVGEMSLVGTRPPTADEVMHYDKRHWQRLNVKPGLTGEWQVNGRSHVKDFEQIVDLDMRYQKQWYPMYDVLLILRTVLIIFARVGAF
ncbi:sugar transferase [Aetokthonos hydrillicola Thurmond2011]|jgi:lipopolysaccharide/colanic/teichoic acid biosynthesis glycosyltransferase|uniref:Sugar transferase n=1 Tax=Aetokthonos hydrillicola Thurmond2011 TaxID=2712845 RepID=A0AAP5IDC2_9CYAN|nr:sugar transferase [Aetokthonos hydrillicola]MBO3463748.1 sugar transferase [Aetokthonos hydrillicola CCALA 1050]MBW4585753.1 sugar transferase [Aetokthonos hydrillicola CCALA 1050]MDR9899257.1 sugar transferase [Aetokthonos hydrillicola Thurmond2011]